MLPASFCAGSNAIQYNVASGISAKIFANEICRSRESKSGPPDLPAENSASHVVVLVHCK